MELIEYIDKTIYDGTGTNIEDQEFEINFNNTNILLSINEIRTNQLSKLQDNENLDIREIMARHDLELKGNISKRYVSKDKLTVYFKIEKNNIIIISFGEFQPGRYIINLESIWETK